MFKNLILNRNEIEGVVQQYLDKNYNNATLKVEQKSEYQYRFQINAQSKKLFLDIYYNNKGGTTIQVNNGKEQNEKKKIADFIIKHPLCKMDESDKKNRSMMFKNITEEEFQTVLQIISEDENCATCEDTSEDEKRGISKLTGKWSDKITITYMKTTRNVRIQGRPLLIFNTAVSYFTELIDVDELVNNLEENLGQNIDKVTVEKQYKLFLPNSYDRHSDKLKKSLLKAVYNLNIKNANFTCTELAFEALRAIEGHIKITFGRDYMIGPPNRRGALSMFRFNEETGVCTLGESIRRLINNPLKVTYYEKAYKHLAIYRHKIFHWDYPDPDGFNVDETIHIEEISRVHQIIKDTLGIIDEYYK